MWLIDNVDGLAAYGSNVGGNQTNNVYNYITLASGMQNHSVCVVIVVNELGSYRYLSAPPTNRTCRQRATTIQKR